MQMTRQADGTVYINSKLDTSGFKPGSKEIEAACRRAARSVKGMGDSAKIALERQVNAFVKQNQMYAQQEQKVEALKKKLDELKGQKIPTEAFSALEKEAQALNAELDKVKAKQKEWIDMGFPESDAIQKTKKDYDEIAKKIDQVRQKQEELVNSGKGYTLPDTSAINEKLIAETERLGQMNSSLGVSYDALKYKIEQYGGTMSGLVNQHALLRKSFSSVSDAVKKGASIVGGIAKKAYNGFLKNVNKLKNAMSGLQKETKKTNNSLNLSIKTLLKYGLGIRSLFVLFNKIRGAIKEGFGNLAQYSDKTNASLSALKSSLTQLKNSLATAFNPILSVIAPILTKFINMLSQAITYVGMFFAALTGQKSFTKAVAVQESYAESLEDTADAAKEAKKYLSGLDEIRTYTEDKDTSNKGGAGGGISPSDMFEEVEIPQNILDIAEKIKDILSKLFEPLKKAWEQEGQFVMDSWKYALEEVWKLIKDIGRDFLTVWQEDETVAIFANILHIIGDIGLVVGHLARNFREAWNTNQVGLAILRNIRDVIGIIVQHIRNAADATVKWADKLDFYPILDALERFLDSIKPVVEAVWGVLEDFYTKVLLPLSKWVIEKGLPEFLQVLIDFNNKVDWGSLRKNLAEFWEHLEPFAETVGEGLIIFIQRVSDALANFINSQEFKDFLKAVQNWMDSVTPQDVADALESIAKGIIALKVALIGFSAIKGITGILTTVKSFLSFFGVGGAGTTIAGNIETTSTALSGFVSVLSDFAIATAAAVAAIEPFKDKMFELAAENGAQAQTVADAKNQYNGFMGTLRLVKDEVTGLILGMEGLPATIASSVGAVDALNKAMEAIADGTIYTDEQMRKMQDTWGFTADDVEMLRQEMLDTHPELRNLADQFPALSDASAESLEQISKGFEYVKNGITDTDDIIFRLHHSFGELTPTAETFFDSFGDGSRAIEDINYELENGEQVIDGYVTSLQDTSGAVEQFSNDIIDATANIGEGLNAGMESVETDPPAQGFFSRLVESIKSIFGIHSPASTMMPFGENILLGVLEGFKSQFELFYELVSQLLDQISLKLTEGWETMKQDAIETWESVKESLAETWENIKGSAIEKWEEIKEEISTKLEDAKERITSTIDDAKQKWSDGWENMSQKVSSILETIKSAINSAFEWISQKVAAIKEKLSSIGSGISGAIGGLFSGASTFSINASGLQTPIMPVPQIATAKIPYLATGAVIPPNAPFLAVLGDQKRGTNVEAPLSAIEDTVNKAVRNAMSNQQRNGTYIFNAQLNRRTIFSEIISEAKLHQTVTGRNPFELA